MATSTPERAKVTNWLLDHVTSTATDFLVGDIESPKEAGWQDDSGSADAEFVPYIVFIPGTSQAPTGTLSDGGIDWKLPYTGTTYGVDRRQVEDLADTVRTDLLKQLKISLSMSDGSTWKILNIVCMAMGGVGYTNAVVPTAFSETDSYVITLSKSLA